MFNKNTYYKNKLIIVPKHQDKNNIKNINSVEDLKPNNNNKSYEKIRNIVENTDEKKVVGDIPRDIEKIL